MTGSSKPQGWALVPPPLLFALPLVAGVLLDRRLSPVHPSHPLATGLWWAGVLLIVVGAAHTLSSAVLFARSRTTLVPHHRSSTIVVRGAYRWTRNPMYLGLTLVYLGVSAVAGAILPLLLLPLPVLVLDRRIIPMEERQLEEAFGRSYLEYRARVRRWI